jgi:hypothetical protein
MNSSYCKSKYPNLLVYQFVNATYYIFENNTINYFCGLGAVIGGAKIVFENNAIYCNASLYCDDQSWNTLEQQQFVEEIAFLRNLQAGGINPSNTLHFETITGVIII